MTSIAAGALNLLLVRLFVVGMSVLSTMVTARALGPEGRGQYYYAIMVGALIVQFGTLGLHASNTYLVAQSRERLAALAANSLWVTVAVAAAVAAVFAVVRVVTGESEGALGVPLWIVLYVPAGLFVQLVASLLLGSGRLHWYNGVQLAVAIAALAGVGVAALMSADAAGFVGSFTLANTLIAVLLIAWLARNVRVSWRFDRAAFDEGWRFAARSFAVSVLGFLVVRANVFLIASMLDSEQVGLYSVAMQFFDVLSLAPVSIATVLFPSLVTSHSAWSDTLRYAVVVAVLVGCAALLLIWLVEPAIEFAFGAEFLGARGATVLILPAAVFMGVTSIFSQYLAAKGLPASVLWVWVASALLAFALGGALITRSGAEGAASALSLTYCTTAILMGIVATVRSRAAAIEANAERC